LFRSLSLREHHFGHPVTKSAMMVHFGEPQVLERQVPDPIESSIHVDRPGTYLLKQVPELVSIHDASITKLVEPPVAVASLRSL
jgi:hypothetical protein